MTSRTPWLSQQELAVWRLWLRAAAVMPEELHRSMVQHSALSLSDFEVLVRLSESRGGRLRMADLATSLVWDRSRLSHQIRRMEGRGLVARERCTSDGRGTFAVITDDGWRALEEAAPAHAETVRALVFDALDPAEVDVLGSLFRKVLTRMGDRPEG